MDPDKISKVIKSIRQKENLSQQKFALKYNVSFQAVSKWENGKSIPDLLTLKKICDDFSLDLNELLNGKEKKNKKPLVLALSVLFLVVLALLSLFIFGKIGEKENFQFKTLSTTCENFNLFGSIAYNDTKSSIYISNITYCGGNDDNPYNRIECVLYETVDKTKKEVSRFVYDEEKPISLEEFLKKVDFHVDNYERVCKEYEENDLELEIDAIDTSNNHTTYKIPLTPKENC